MNQILKETIAEVLATPDTPTVTKKQGATTKTKERALAKYPHGHRNRYFIAGCRCVDCSQSASEYARAKRMERHNTPIDRIPHGTKNGYSNYGCRCRPCKSQMYEYIKRYADKKRG